MYFSLSWFVLSPTLPSLWCSSQRYETLLKDMEKKSEQHREVLSSLQQEFQKAQGMAVGKA